MVFGVLSWNLFHGRDFPPEPELRHWRYRLWPGEWRRGDHVQVNRSLRPEFAVRLAGWEWDVALLQEAPPRWLRPLAREAHAHGASGLTSRNSFAWGRAAVADWNPDLIASNEGGSNQLLVRPPWRIDDVRRVELARSPERRTAIWARLVRDDGTTVCVANAHCTAVGDHSRSAREVLWLAERCVEWDARSPLVFGGDLNLRPREHPWAFDELRERFGLAPPTGDDAVDHVLARGAPVVDAPRRLAPDEREVPHASGARARLSDHAPVAARFGLA